MSKTYLVALISTMLIFIIVFLTNDPNAKIASFMLSFLNFIALKLDSKD